MEKLNIYYSKEFYKLYGKHAMMDPDTIKLGNIIDPDTCEVIGSLNNLGIDFTEMVKSDIPDAEPIYKSKNIEVGDLSVGQESIAKVDLEFKSDHALYLSTKGSKIVGIAEDHIGENGLGAQIIKLYNKDKKKSKWNKDWIVVTEVEYTKKALIIISNGKNAKIELKAQSPSPINIGEMINADLSFGKESSIGFKYIMPEGEYRTILFKAKAINRSIFDVPRLAQKRIRMSRNMPSVSFKKEIEEPKYLIKTKEPAYLTDFMWDD